MHQLTTNAYEIFDQKVTNRQSYLQNDMIHRWSNMDDAVNSINSDWESLRSNYATSDELLSDRPALDSFLMEVADNVIYTLRRNSVTGAFIILDQPMIEKGAVVSRPGLYVRDTDPESSAKNNSDLSIKHGSSALYRQLGITTDIDWMPRFSFDSAYPERNKYFTMPMEAAKTHPQLATSDLGYWNTTSGSASMLTYSVPLVDSSGEIYGVMGVDISHDYLRKMLPANELNANRRATYCLVRTTPNSDQLHVAAISGSHFGRFFTTSTVLTPRFDDQAEEYFVDYGGDQNCIAYVDLQYLQLYNEGTPFIDDQWGLLGVINTRDLLQFPTIVNHLAIASSIITILVGMVLCSIVITLLTTPIRKLIAILRASDPNKPVNLTRVYVTEIDELSSAIEDLSLRVSKSSSTLSRIIEMSDINIAAFEVDKLTNFVVCSGQLFPILEINDVSFDQLSISLDDFKTTLDNANLVVDEVLEKGWIIHVYSEQKVIKWIKITLMDEPNRVLGVLVDITEDTLSKRHIEYERDYDLLTNLLNRRAFMVAIRRLFESPDDLKVSALLLIDLDNLKFINDSYGHDCGDGYLRAVASAMRKLPVQNLLLSRMSGDEFFVFIYGSESKAQVRQYISELKQIIAESYYILPGGDSTRIRCSAGITWYPDDTTLLEDLTRYADFAMYSAKNYKKGDFCEFVKEDYDKNSYLLHSREELNKLIEHRMLDYHFQPIVDALTGNVFAYEALMRSRLSTLHTPMEVLSLARSQSKLYEIERLTWFCALEASVNDPLFTETDCRIFINSVSNHILNDDDTEGIRSTFQKHLSRIVLEITEEEKFNEDITRKKQKLLYGWGGAVALDDFGTGYNGEMVLLQLVPDYVKIDMSIVRNIDTDPSRQELFRNLVKYSHERNIMVIAEGVETNSEMSALIHLGADFLQGYYLGMPERKMQTLPQKIISEIHSIVENTHRLTEKKPKDHA